MEKTISFKLSQDSIDKAIKELKQYKFDLDEKCKLLCEKLCESGIQIAESHIDYAHGFGKFVHLSSKIEPEKAGCKAMFYMADSQKVVSEWKIGENDTKSAEVSPMLMLEFGSGMRAENPAGIEGMGQGSFPGQIHAFDKGGWNWQDLDGYWHHSSGVQAQLPMYHAGMDLRNKVIEIAKEVFR